MDGGKADRYRGLLAGLLQKAGFRYMLHRLITFEHTVGAVAPCVNHPFRYFFPGKVGQLFKVVKILKERGAAVSDFQRFTVIGKLDPLLRGERLVGVFYPELVQLLLFGILMRRFFSFW